MPKARAGSLNRQRGKAVDNGGLRYGAMESALRPPLPTATPPIGDLPYRSFAEARFLHRLTNPAGQNIITPISGSTRKVAGIKSEPRPASNRNQWPASCRMPGRLRRNPHRAIETFEDNSGWKVHVAYPMHQGKRVFGMIEHFTASHGCHVDPHNEPGHGALARMIDEFRPGM